MRAGKRFRLRASRLCLGLSWKIVPDTLMGLKDGLEQKSLCFAEQLLVLAAWILGLRRGWEREIWTLQVLFGESPLSDLASSSLFRACLLCWPSEGCWALGGKVGCPSQHISWPHSPGMGSSWYAPSWLWLEARHLGHYLFKRCWYSRAWEGRCYHFCFANEKTDLLGLSDWLKVVVVEPEPKSRSFDKGCWLNGPPLFLLIHLANWNQADLSKIRIHLVFSESLPLSFAAIGCIHWPLSLHLLALVVLGGGRWRWAKILLPSQPYMSWCPILPHSKSDSSLLRTALLNLIYHSY